MRVSYYPGCSVKGTAREYDESTRAVCQALEIELDELTDWNCCGATSAHCTNGFLALALPARNLSLAEKRGVDLVVPCAACYQRLKVAEKKAVNNPLLDFPYQGTINIKHLIDFCSQEEIFRLVRERLKKTLTGLRVACYYGCLVVRPPKVTDAIDYEDPQNMDQLVNLLGAESVSWCYKTDCCGGSLFFSRPDVVRRLIQKILDAALEAGAECVATCCPMCQSNLDIHQKELSIETGKDYSVPVFYFTELLGLALGSPGVDGWLRRHFVSPRGLLSARGLL